MEKMINMGEVDQKHIAGLEAKEADPLALCQLQIHDLQKQLEISRQEWNDLYGLLIDSMSDDDFANLLSGEMDYSRWFRLLSCAVTKYLVVLTVRDTPGEYMPDHVYKAILDAGFVNFEWGSEYTYVGVIHKGKIWCDEGKHHNEPTRYSYESMDGSLSVQAFSESGENGNRGEIFINDKQVAKNDKGVNIVVYDTQNNRVIDSVRADFSVEGHDVFRR